MSDDVQRYNMTTMQYNGPSVMRVANDGKWVEWRDYARLRAELAEKDRRIEHLEIAVELKALGLRECQDAIAGRNRRIEELEEALLRIDAYGSQDEHNFEDRGRYGYPALKKIARRALGVSDEK